MELLIQDKFYKAFGDFLYMMVTTLLSDSIYPTVKKLILCALGKLYYLMHPTHLKIHSVYLGTWRFHLTLAIPPDDAVGSSQTLAYLQNCIVSHQRS